MLINALFAYKIIIKIMKSQRSSSWLNCQANSMRNPKIEIKLVPKNEESQEKSMGMSRSSSKKLKLRDYIYQNQIKEKKCLLSKSSSSQLLTAYTFTNFTESSSKTSEKNSPIKHKKHRIQTQEILMEVQRDISQDLDQVIKMAQKLKEDLANLPKTNPTKQLMIELYQMRHKIKYNTLSQLKGYQKQIINLQDKNRIQDRNIILNGKVSLSMPIHLTQSHYEHQQDKKNYDSHKVCMLKRRGINNR